MPAGHVPGDAGVFPTAGKIQYQTDNPMHQTPLKSLLAAVGLFAVSSSLFGGSPVSVSEKSPQAVSPPGFESLFARGQDELEIGMGGYGSIITDGTLSKPGTCYGLAQLHYGMMLSNIGGSGIYRGNFELLPGIFGGPMFQGPGCGLLGAEALARYNFVQPGAHLAPFFELGVGGVYSDAAKDNTVQRLIGANLSFDLETAIGARWQFNPRWALELKLEYRHYSNAGLAKRNQGLNAIGGVVGVSYFLERNAP